MENHSVPELETGLFFSLLLSRRDIYEKPWVNQEIFHKFSPNHENIRRHKTRFDTYIMSRIDIRHCSSRILWYFQWLQILKIFREITDLFGAIEWNAVALVTMHMTYSQTKWPIKLFHKRRFGVVFSKLKSILLQLFFGVFKEKYKIYTIPVKLHLNLQHLVHKIEEVGNFLRN